MKALRLKDIFQFSREDGGKRFVKNFAKVLFTWCPVVSLLFVFGFGGIDDFFRRFLVSLIIATTCASACMIGSELIEQIEAAILRRLGRPVPEHGYLWGVLTAYIFLVPGLYVGFRLAGAYSASAGRKWSGPNFGDYSSGLIFGIMVSGLFLLFEVMRDAKEAKKEVEFKHQKLENERLKAQVSALTAQMNPHLLFNSLNTIASTISSNPESAEEMTVQLSELYRGVLKSAKEETHLLANELELCRSYLDIEKNRFGDRVRYKINVDPSVDVNQITVPVLLLQPIVENSIKHGISPKKSGGTISIDIIEEDNVLKISIKDDGVGLVAEKSKGTGTGIKNCRSRLQIKYGDAGRFEFNRTESGALTLIRLPLSEVAYG